MPAVLRPDISKVPPVFVMKRAFPPVLELAKLVVAPLLVVIVALLAVLEPVNCSELLLMIVAVPAHADVLNVTVPVAALVMLALPAEVESWKLTTALLVIAALPAVL